MTRILVVDDEPALRTAVQRALSVERYDVSVAPDGAAALDLMLEARFDAVVLDVAMPRVDGLEVTRRLRAAGDSTPVLMLSARDAVDDRVEGLEAGADDYLVKPFALRELHARVQALIRRADVSPGVDATLRFADVVFERADFRATRGAREMQLTRTEASLLELFLENPRRALTRTDIFERVWGYDFGSTSNSLGVYVGYLRRKLEAGGESRLIHTIRGVGYILREPNPPGPG